MARVDLEYPVTDLTAARWAADLYYGESLGDLGSVPNEGSDRYMLERSAIGGLFVARTVESTVIPDDSLTGFRFRTPLPDSLSDAPALCDWIQEVSHKALDTLVDSDPNIASAANRYEDLVWVNQQREGRTSRPRTRRQALRFQQAVTEPLAWLQAGAVAGQYQGLEIRPEQALHFVDRQLTIMQRSARKDVGKERVRGAIGEVFTELGEMRNQGDSRDTEMRYQILRLYVATITGHQLLARSFKNLYSVEPDEAIGVRLSERPQGFGRIQPVRATPRGCPASYKMLRKGQRDHNGIGSNALAKLLRAGITALDESGTLASYATTSRTPVPIAFNKLRQNAAKKHPGVFF
jgi:hypothetical protein